MYLSDSDIKRMIVEHINEIDKDLKQTVTKEVRAELYKAKSKALEVLAENFKK